jgi:hypothetical protein
MVQIEEVIALSTTLIGSCCEGPRSTSDPIATFYLSMLYTYCLRIYYMIGLSFNLTSEHL